MYKRILTIFIIFCLLNLSPCALSQDEFDLPDLSHEFDPPPIDFPTSIPEPEAAVIGCIDTNAYNYDPEATVSGTCYYDSGGTNSAVIGCIDTNAYNYDPEATVSGTCYYDSGGTNSVYGCRDPDANNYDAEADTDDGTCYYGTPPLYGCRDPDANNYDAEADTDDGTCEYYSINEEYFPPEISSNDHQFRAQFETDGKLVASSGTETVDVFMQSGEAQVQISYTLTFRYPNVLIFKFDIEKDSIYAYFKQDDSPDSTEELLASVSGTGPGTETGTVYVDVTKLDPDIVWKTLSWCQWFNPCPAGYSNLHSDFHPVLDTKTSGLKLTNGVPSLKVDFTLRHYYFDVTVSYSQCDADNDLSVSVSAVKDGDTCSTLYETEINYVDYCDFALAENDQVTYSYSGTLTIRASLHLTVGEFEVVRTLEGPVNWVLYLDRQVTVNTNVELVNDDTCANNYDCNNQGCCEQVTDSSPAEYYCNCGCEFSGQASGYSGTYCEEDITPPTCSIPDAQLVDCPGCSAVATALAITIPSEHGGCKKYDFAAVLPTFNDNSGTWYTSRKDFLDGDTTAPPGEEMKLSYDAVDLNDLCFNIGSHEIIYHVSDTPGYEHYDNEHAFCGYFITVVDESKPYVDCSQCNNDGTTAHVCVGNTLHKNVAQADLSNFFNDQYIADNGAVTFAGDSLTCDCTGTQDINEITTTKYYQGFNEWGTIFSIDVHDTSVTTVSPVATDYPTDFADQTLTYSATDDDSNTGQCSITVTVDTTPPTCAGINLGTVDTALVAHPIHTETNINGNYTAGLSFNLDDMVTNFDVSGLKSGPTIGDLHKNTDYYGPPPTSDDIYYLNPSDVSTKYTATISIEDNAGNVGSCIWIVKVVNPAPCVWPECEDRPPTCNNSPQDKSYNCGDNGDCGCGNWADPILDSELPFNDENNEQIFVDDRGIVDSSRTSSHLPDTPLKLGETTIEYKACDYHGVAGDPKHCAVCSFTITYTDNTDPIFTTCPKNDKLNTDTSTYDYDYSVSATDACVLNEGMKLVGGRTGDTDITKTDDQSDFNAVSYSTLTEGGTLSLAVGAYGFLWTAYDSSGRSHICEWSIEIIDNHLPEINCNFGDDDSINYYVRINQGETDKTVPFFATASDTNDGNLNSAITYTLNGDPITDAYLFVFGEYTITAYVEDKATNSATCDIKIVVVKPYPTVYFRPSLTKANIHIDGNDFKADIAVTTLTNAYHHTNSVTFSTGSPDLVTEPRSCTSTDAVCKTVYGATVNLGTDCKSASSGISYLFDYNVECRGRGYGETNQHPEDVCHEADLTSTFTIELVASNYCWQTIAGVEITANFITVPIAQFDDWQNGGAKPTLHVAAFANFDYIAGIITVESTQINAFNGVTLTAMKKTHDSTSSYDLVGDAVKHGVTIYDSVIGTGGPDWAAFTYQERNVALQAVQAVSFTGTVTISGFSFGRRRLFDVDTQRYLQQNGDSLLAEAVAETLMTAQPIAAVAGTTNPDDAIVVMMLQNCDETNDEWETALIGAIAKYLRIDTSRVVVEIDPTSEGYCLVEVTISQSDCAGTVDIVSLLEYLENGLMDTFSELHTYVAQDLPVDVSLDHTVFFVAQQPSTIYESASVSSASTSTTSSSELAWYYYIVAGFMVGIVAIVGASKLFSGSKSNDSVKHSPLTPERRYSIADLLAATERRSSIDVNNVRLHNAL